jgi:hypothetical protein
MSQYYAELTVCDCQEEFFVNNPLGVKENYHHVLS